MLALLVIYVVALPALAASVPAGPLDLEMKSDLEPKHCAKSQARPLCVGSKMAEGSGLSSCRLMQGRAGDRPRPVTHTNA
jgi:hypothetical protein